jgi:general secretion pathway protein L
MTDVLAVILRDQHLDCAVVRHGLSTSRPLGAFRVDGLGSLGPLDTEGDAGTALRTRLRELGARVRRLHVGLPRRLAIVKAISLPAVTGADRRRMVGFELERHLPFPPGEALFDFAVLDEAPGRPLRVLLVAVERRLVEPVLRLGRELGLTPRLVDVAVHGLALPPGGAEGPRRGRLTVWIEEGEAELAVVVGGRLVASRAVPLPTAGRERGESLTRELRRTLGVLSAEDRGALATIAVGGTDIPDLDARDLPHLTRLAGPRERAHEGAPFLPALALAARRPTAGPLRTNLLPDDLRPRPFPWPVAVTAALALLVAALGASIPVAIGVRDARALAAVEREVAQLAPAVRRVERLAADVEVTRRELETLRGFETRTVRALPVLRELTELLPADVWLTTFSADRTGIELGGFAGSASPLIALLEASPRFDRVEFTSPVTKGRDREQFRLKAAWERPAGGTQ